VINYAIALYANGEKLSNGAGSKVVNSTFNAMVERSNRSRPTTNYQKNQLVSWFFYACGLGGIFNYADFTRLIFTKLFYR